MALLFRRLILISLAGIALLSGVAGYGYYHYNAPGPLTEPATVLFPHGERLQTIADELANHGVIPSAWLFMAEATASGHAHALKAGEYRFAAGISAREAIAMMAAGKVVVHKLTIAEGLSVAEVSTLLNAQPELSGPLPADIPEGSLLPETYQFVYGDARAGLVRRMQALQRKTLAELWTARQPGLPLATPEQALVLASIVEKETGVDGERGQVARVFLNRLQRGMPLQSDPTTRYGLSVRGIPPHPLTSAELRDPSPYNTYVIPGLPPAPICNPGRATLAAILNPPPGNALYFVATGSGGHYFSDTLEEHNRRVQQYREKIRRQ